MYYKNEKCSFRCSLSRAPTRLFILYVEKKLEYKIVYPPKKHSIFKLLFFIDDFEKKGIEFDLFLKFIFTTFDQVYHDDLVNLIQYIFMYYNHNHARARAHMGERSICNI